MAESRHQGASQSAVLRDRDVLTGVLLVAFATLGLWLSRNYPVGTTLRMGTGYMPRLLCWILLGLGGLIGVKGLVAARRRRGRQVGDGMSWRPIVFVSAGIVLFALSLERLGLVIAIAVLTATSSFARRELNVKETILAALVLIILSWAIFVLGNRRGDTRLAGVVDHGTAS